MRNVAAIGGGHVFRKDHWWIKEARPGVIWSRTQAVAWSRKGGGLCEWTDRFVVPGSVWVQVVLTVFVAGLTVFLGVNKMVSHKLVWLELHDIFLNMGYLLNWHADFLSFLGELQALISAGQELSSAPPISILARAGNSGHVVAPLCKLWGWWNISALIGR